METQNVFKLTADDEEPKCNRCDHFCGDFDCESQCGAVHGWYGYQRMETINE